MVDYKELYCFLADTLLMPHIKKKSVNEYWSTDKTTPIFGRIMKRDRYLLIMKLLNFSNNDVAPEVII